MASVDMIRLNVGKRWGDKLGWRLGLRIYSPQGAWFGAQQMGIHSLGKCSIGKAFYKKTARLLSGHDNYVLMRACFR